MTARWNLLVYAIAGDAREHQCVLAEIDDMRDALASDQCQIAVQVMARRRTTRYWITAADRFRTEILPEAVDASRQTALTGFLNAAARRLPAASTALVLRAHGSGLDHIHDYPHKAGGLGGVPEIAAAAAPWGQRLLELPPPEGPDRYGCRWGPDPTSGRFLTNITMKKAISASAAGCMDVLALNACWMATLEIEYELRGAAAVQVASQVNAKPWPYRAIVDALSAEPDRSDEDLARLIVTSVDSEIACDARQDAVSALRAGAAIEELAEAFDGYARRATQLIDSDWDGVRDAVMTRAQRIDDPLQVDLVSLTRVLGDRDPAARAAAEQVSRRFDATRIAHAAHAAHPGVNGLSIFCPKSTRIDLASAYKGTEFRTHAWAGFLDKFQRRLASS